MVNLVHLTIDNKPITVPAGTTILEAAEHNGIPIPKLCYLKVSTRSAPAVYA